MSEELPDPGLRIITIIVKPGVDPEVQYDGFAYWEALAALKRVFEIIDDESELSYGLPVPIEEETPGDDES